MKRPDVGHPGAPLLRRMHSCAAEMATRLLCVIAFRINGHVYAGTNNVSSTFYNFLLPRIRIDLGGQACFFSFTGA